MFAYLTDYHSEGEDVDLLIVRATSHHLGSHPVRVSDDRFTLVTTKQSALG